MRRELQTTGSIVVYLEKSNKADMEVKDLLKADGWRWAPSMGYWYLKGRGFKDLAQFDSYLSSLMNGEKAKRGVAPTKTAYIEHYKNFRKTDEAKAITEAKREWVRAENAKKFEHIVELCDIPNVDNWGKSVATVIEKHCEEERSSMYKLSDIEIRSLETKYMNEIVEVSAEIE